MPTLYSSVSPCLCVIIWLNVGNIARWLKITQHLEKCEWSRSKEVATILDANENDGIHQDGNIYLFIIIVVEINLSCTQSQTTRDVQVGLWRARTQSD